jgi:AraC-like DNA-binding protein
MGATVTPMLDVPSLRLGRFRCAPTDEEWRAENDIGPLAHVVFPERPVTITRSATGPQLGDRNWALLYRPGQRYQRQLVDPDGDECTFVALSPQLYGNLLDADRSATAAFDAGRVLVDDASWLGYQECLAAAPGRDDRAVERALCAVLHEVVRRPAAGAAGTAAGDEGAEAAGTAGGDEGVDDRADAGFDEGPGDVGAGRPVAAVREADRRVHEACRILATRLDERLTLPAVAEAVGLSTYHFCRLFRATTGLTVHGYRKRLRLRAAFSTCASLPHGNLSDVAMSLGYASHSHMTTEFRTALAITPSGVRDRYARRTAEAGIFNLR